MRDRVERSPPDVQAVRAVGQIDIVPTESGRRWWLEAATVLLAFTLLSAVLYQTPLVTNPSGFAAGLGLRDNDQFVWFLGWAAHAIPHALNPLQPRIVFAPDGYNLARTTPMLTYGIVLAPLTWIAGPVVSYNVAMLSVPALNGSIAFALCRRIGAKPQAAALGGFVFAATGVVSFAELGAPTTGSGVFVGAALLLTIDLVDGRRFRRNAVLLGLDLLAQLYSAAEPLALMLLYGALALAVTWMLDRDRRPAIRRALRPLAAAGAILIVGALPYVLTFALAGGPSLTHDNANLYPSDLLAFIVPSSLQWLGHSSFASVAASFPAESPTAYLGIGLVAITLWYIIGRWREAVEARILGVVVAAIAVCSFGTHLTIDGHRTIALPWALFAHLPLLRYVLPTRSTLFVALGLTLGLVLWLNSSTARLKWVVAVAACALLIPNPGVRWSTSLHVPRLFSSGAAARELAGERVMALPFAGPDEADQAVAGFAFSLAGGYLGQYPNSYGDYIGATYLIERTAPPGAPAAVAQLVRAKGVDAVVVDASAPGPWRKLLSGLGVRPVSRDGVLIYDLTGERHPARHSSSAPSVTLRVVPTSLDERARCRHVRRARRAVPAVAAAAALAGCGSSATSSHGHPAASTPGASSTSSAASTPTPTPPRGTVTVSATPNPVPAGAGAGTTVIHWVAPSSETVVIRVAVNGGARKLFAAAHGSGSAKAPFIVAPNRYKFTLSVGPKVIDSVLVTRS